jgi:hypothetical protein
MDAGLVVDCARVAGLFATSQPLACLANNDHASGALLLSVVLRLTPVERVLISTTSATRLRSMMKEASEVYTYLAKDESEDLHHSLSEFLLSYLGRRYAALTPQFRQRGG